MIISKSIENAFNEQINAELFSSYLYLSMSAYFTANNLTGFASWFAIQAKEEVEHAMKMYKFVLERGGKITLKTINAPKNDFKSALEIVDEAYKHELLVTSLITKLYETSLSEKDYASANFLKWFIDEQVEEEANTSQIVEWVKMTDGKASTLMMVDHQMSKRAKD